VAEELAKTNWFNEINYVESGQWARAFSDNVHPTFMVAIFKILRLVGGSGTNW